ncbi:lipoprotein [Halomonas sp. HMF6819]|nr:MULTISPECIES: lipoprotein [unclassified Halomonas]
MKALALIALVTLLLAGCGQKGPLYLPDDNAPIAAEES